WRYKHPEREFPFYSSPAVTSEVVVVGGRDKMIHALDVKTGKVQWTHTMRTRIDASPVIIGDRVIVADQSGILRILDLEDGGVSWEFTADDAFLGSPAVTDGIMVIAAGDGAVYAFTGAPARKAPAPAP
ncbi:MAG: PQQ-binding-like beta-propeller repeat protein, partial [Acidobacteriota bacterium]